jgi:Ca2+-binding RTX toxin-like protein
LHATALTDDFTNNTTRVGEIVVNGPSTSGVVNYGNDSDWFAVTVSAGQAVHFSIDHPGLIDVRLELVGLSSMTPFNRVGHGFTYYFAQGGTYYVQAAGTYYEEAGGYTITATTLADDFAATVATTGALAVGGSASGVINYNYDSDWFEISLAAGVEYTFSLTGLSGGGHLSVYDENGVVISSTNDTYVVSADFTALYDGVHYIRVTNGSSGNYTISAAIDPAVLTPSLLQSIDPNVPSILPGDAFQHTHYGPANVVQVYFAGMGEAFGGSTSTGWTAEDTAAVMAILAQFEAYLNIDFQITTTLPHADLVLTTFSDPNYVTRFDRADWDMPIPAIGFSTAVSTWNAAALAEGGLGAATVLNAIGYAMGLAFPHLAESGSVLMEGVDDDTDLGDFNLNQGIHTIMSFNDGWATSGYGVSGSSNYGWQFGPMALDIAVLQSIYGANATYNNGANTYTLRDTNASGTGWRAIWDTGGADTIVYAGTRNATIDLRAATLQYEQGGGGFVSSAFGVHGGFTIANGVVIENATGGAGDDVITGNAVANTLLGNGGADTIDGGGGADIILAHAGADTLLGGDGNDWLDGGAGADTINGGAGNDTAAYGASAAAVNIDLQSGVYSGGDAVGDVLTSIEGISGSSHADNIFGNANANSLFGQGGADFIQGRGGADAIYGGDGNDWLDGGAGADTIDGGAGTDTAAYGASLAAVSIDLQSGVYSGGDAAGDVLLNIEGVSGSSHADNIFGNANANSLFGQGGADFIQGRGGADTISGGDGNDWLDGGTGADAIDGGAGNDTAAYGSSTAAVSIDLQSGVYSGGDAAGDVLTNIEGISGSSHADNIFGNANANSLFGQGGNDFIQGRGGADFIYGGDGNDWLDGGLGADTIDGGAGTDTAAYGSSTAAVSVDLQSGVYSGGDAAGDVLIGIEGVSGSSHNDTLSGNASANTLFGQGGADTLNGRGGNDTLHGGAGNDRFVFTPGAGDDVISDFVAGGAEDWIDLSGYQGSGVTWTITQVGANTVFDFTNGDSITLLNVNAAALTQIDPWSWG